MPGQGKRFSFSPERPDQVWDPHNLLLYALRGLYPRGKATAV